jgi:hypothetical protein
VPLLFALTLFVSALLLFLVEPLVGKLLLPLLGGTPGVWNTCLVFFQAVLLLGYLYAHLSTRSLGPRRQLLVHLAVLALPVLALPIALPENLTPPSADSEQPIGWMLGVLCALVGLPFFVVSTTGPLLQRWFAATGHSTARDPYFLYAASNFGSLLALVAYPVVVETTLPLAQQGTTWTACYGVFVLLTVGCAAAVWGAMARRGSSADGVSAVEAEGDGHALTWARRLRWLGLALVPSSLLLGVTTHLSTDIAAIPLLWVVPLALYLTTFILVFARRPPLPHALVCRLFPPALVLMAIPLAAGFSEPLWLVMPLDLFVFFLAAMVCHGGLARDRPATRHLTEYYLWLSLGGVLGGLFNALAAPELFRYVGNVEYPLVLVLAVLLRRTPARPLGETNSSVAMTRRLDLILPLAVGVLTAGLAIGARALEIPDGPVQKLLIFGPPALLTFTCADRSLRFGLALAALFLAGTLAPNVRGQLLLFERNFFGFVRVYRDPQGRFNQFFHGTTIHGRQALNPELRLEPTAYYTSSGPVGDIFALYDRAAPGRANRDVGIAGLGVGVMSYYRLDGDGRVKHPGARWDYYEIDPAVERIARDERYFTYLRDCFPDRENLRVVLGDARLSLRGAPDGAYALFILDVFSSDSIPVHLLTSEALRLYRRKLAPGGLLAFHISNRYFDLNPALAGLAAKEQLQYRFREDLVPLGTDLLVRKQVGKQNSRWAIMIQSLADLAELDHDGRWQRYDGPTIAWDDDFSNLLGVLKWQALIGGLSDRPGD